MTTAKAGDIATLLKILSGLRVPILGESGGTHYNCICPACDREKMYINMQTFGWDCKVCGASGGLEQLIYHCGEKFKRAMPEEKLQHLAQDRSLQADTLIRWGVGWNGFMYTIPVRIAKDRCVSLLRYAIGGHPLALPGSRLTCGWNLHDGDDVFICEGPWDAMALDEAFTKLGTQAPIYFFPGASVIHAPSPDTFNNKKITVLYDNDRAGQNGAEKLIKKSLLQAQAIQQIIWPSTLAPGYDIRDLYKDSNLDAELFVSKLTSLLTKAATVTVEDETTLLYDMKPITYTEGVPYDTITAAFREKLWLPNLTAVDIILGTFFANRIPGDPVWLFVVGPPGCGKTELIEACVDSQHAHFEESITPSALISGWTRTKVRTKSLDPSIIPRLNGKVLLIKDMTPLLSTNDFDRDAIFGILRGAYDGHCKRTLGNAVIREYKVRFGIIAGVTNVIDKYNAEGVVLGERFLKFRMPYMRLVKYADHIISKALDNIGHETTQQSVLRDVLKTALDKKLEESDFPKLPDELKTTFIRLAQWTVRLRGVVCRERYTGEVQVVPFTEVGTRLAKQLCKLAMGVAMLHGRSTLTDYDVAMAVRVAHDTCPERVIGIVRAMYSVYEARQAIEVTPLATLCGLPPSTTDRVLNDMLLLNIVSHEKKAWALSPTMYRIAKEYRIFETVKATSVITDTTQPDVDVEDYPEDLQRR